MGRRQSNNVLPRLHRLIASEKGENYWFNGCAQYVMESFDESDYDYWFFAGLTGDIFAQVFSNDGFRGDAATDYRLSLQSGNTYLEEVFSFCGYESSRVSFAEISKNRSMYIQTVLSHIDKGVPIILNHKTIPGWAVLVGYEEYGKSLLYISGDKKTPKKTSMDDFLADTFAGWEQNAYGLCFVGEKREEKKLGDIYRNAILGLPELLTTRTNSYCFGAAAFRSWAEEISRGRFDGMKAADFDGWGMYIIYVCNLATNGSCCYTFLDRAFELNPDFGFLHDVKKEYGKIARYWNNDEGRDIEALGGGFNIRLETLQDRERRERIAGKILEMADCMDNVVRILRAGLAINS